MSLESASASLRERLDHGSRSIAVQDIDHGCQQESEPVGDFECIIRSAYGRDSVSREICDALLYGQFQEGLLYDLMKSPAVSGAKV